MANGLNLPRTNISTKGDLITVIQNGVEKNISKLDLLKYLEESINNLSNQVSNLNTQLSRNSIDTTSPSFPGTVSGAAPSSPRNLTTKSYVDSLLNGTIRNDGTTRLDANLSYRNSPTGLQNNDVVPKSYVDNRIRTTLKTLIEIPGGSNYPAAVAGDTFLVAGFSEGFATDGPEVQEGDIIICVNSSAGGTHGAVGGQFAIINTNVVYATEEDAGILKVASTEDLENLDTNASAITPLTYKNVLEDSSDYNRTTFAIPAITLLEKDKGIVAVDTRRNAVTVTLPSITSLEHKKLTKFTIKDEYLNALQNTITINCVGGNTIQNAQRYVISANGGSVTFYNDGANQWYIESNVFSGSELTSGVRTLLTDDITNGEVATSTGAYTAIFSIDVDLKDYPVGTGFKVVAHSYAIANDNTKTTAIGIDGQQVLASSLSTVTAPNNKFIHQEATIMHSNTAQYFAYGFVYVGNNVAAGLTNNLALDWNTTITVSFDVNVSATADITAYSLQVIPLK